MARRHHHGSAKALWRDTPAGQAAYVVKRAEAQALANQHGYDVGLQVNELFKYWSTHALPRRENRAGWELQCEVVSCENLDRCQPGHGPR